MLARNAAPHPWQQTSFPSNSTGICKVRPQVGQTLAKRTELAISISPNEYLTWFRLLLFMALCQCIKGLLDAKEAIVAMLADAFFVSYLHQFAESHMLWLWYRSRCNQRS
ncbi:MAG: hypothetical protein WCK15_03065 [Pirellula sp.]